MILYRLTQFFCKTLAKILFRLKVEGLENLPKEKGFILAANHASSLDPFIIISAIPRYIRWTIIYEYYDLWYLRWILKRMRFIRLGNNLPREVFRTLLGGEPIGIFPEGRRTWTGSLGPGRPGVAALARRTSCPVVPVAIAGSFAALPRTRKRLKLCPITVRIGAALFFSQAQNKKENERIDQENTQRIMQSISELLRG
jgi:1-acyl-sn-glycerol-3-phosphate acyltransferase